VDALVRRGRSRGIGLSLITQRPAVVNKDCVSQADCLIALRLTGSHDRRAAKEWMASNGQDDKEFLHSLPTLVAGEAWVWYPSGGVFERISVRTRLTKDTSKTPEFVPTGG
jgi:DNA helicase HerA-like ATPase